MPAKTLCECGITEYNGFSDEVIVDIETMLSSPNIAVAIVDAFTIRIFHRLDGGKQ